MLDYTTLGCDIKDHTIFTNFAFEIFKIEIVWVFACDTSFCSIKERSLFRTSLQKRIKCSSLPIVIQCIFIWVLNWWRNSLAYLSFWIVTIFLRANTFLLLCIKVSRLLAFNTICPIIKRKGFWTFNLNYRFLYTTMRFWIELLTSWTYCAESSWNIKDSISWAVYAISAIRRERSFNRTLF